jgi:hypothetical protein
VNENIDELDAQEDELDEQSRPEETLIDMLGASLRSKLAENLGLRLPIEMRWIADTRQFHGNRSVEEILNSPKKATGSDRKVNVTRTKTNNAEARMTDLLFPNDDKNWGIAPTPVPELMDELQNDKPVQDAEGNQFAKGDGSTVTGGDLAQREMAIAAECAKKMEKEIEDQLTEAHYGDESRKVIRYSALLGTGIMRAPIVVGRERKAWQEVGGEFKQIVTKHTRPGAKSVSPWDFVPDMSATKIENASFTFERSYLTRSQTANLAVRDGINEERLKRLLAATPASTHISGQTHLQELRALSGLTASGVENRYEVWIYHGPIQHEHLLALGVIAADEEEKLQQYHGVVWFCGATVLKAAINPMPSPDELPYSVFCWEEDEACIFGYGIPWLCRDSQAVVNDSWQAVIDNGEISSGAQIVVNQRAISPANSDWKISRNKVWHMNGRSQEVGHAFQTYEFPNHQKALYEVFQAAREMVDEETGLPAITGGEQGVATPTFGGMAMLMNAALASLRAQVKRWDDRITTPVITRFYDWNMKFNPKKEIKGDFCVDARGSSALLARELMANQLAIVLNNYAGHPVLSQYTKVAEAYRKLVQAWHLEPDSIVYTDEELEQKAKAQADAESQGGETDPMVALKQEEIAVRREELQLKRDIAMVELEKQRSDERIAVMRLAQDKEIGLAEIDSRLQAINTRERVSLHMFNQEVKLKLAKGEGI